MYLTEFRKHFQKQLSGLYPKEEIDTFFSYAIQELMDITTVDIILYPKMKISEKEKLSLNAILNRLKNEEPIQYILGKTEFFGLPFHVSKDTLIPRPETEELVAWILESCIPDKPIQILDIGTGTGCIPISLQKHLVAAKISALDISEKALNIAKNNAILNSISINFMIADILTLESLNGTYDIIVSNPPYVRMSEKKEMKNNVLANEPHLALFVEDDDPLLFYSKILSLAKKHLRQNGFLFFEINQYLQLEMENLCKKYGFQNFEFKEDLRGNIRMLKIVNS